MTQSQNPAWCGLKGSAPIGTERSPAALMIRIHLSPIRHLLGRTAGVVAVFRDQLVAVFQA